MHISNSNSAGEYLDAFVTLRRGKNIVFWLVLLPLLAQMVVFTLRHVDSQEADEPQAPPPTTEVAGSAEQLLETAPPATQPAPADIGTRQPPASAGDKDYTWAICLLGAGQFVAPAAAVVFVALVYLSLLVSLSGGLGGARGLAGAAVWSLLVLVSVYLALSPFAQLQQVFASFGADHTWGDVALAYAQYVGLPLLVVVLLGVVQVKFHRGAVKIIPPLKQAASASEETPPETDG